MSDPQSPGAIADALQRLRTHVVQIPAKVLGLSDDELTIKAPGKWSRKEILGHLIDSAVNNLKRFTDAQFSEEAYLIQGYNQDKLVIANQYQSLPLAHLIALWRSLNEQILYVAEGMSSETLTHPIRFGQPDKPESTLSWLINDYVAHLEHHLKTLL
jgi:hypothetical protein